MQHFTLPKAVGQSEPNTHPGSFLMMLDTARGHGSYRRREADWKRLW